MKAACLMFTLLLWSSCSRIAVLVVDDTTSEPVSGAMVTRNFFAFHKTNKQGIAYVRGYLHKRYVHVAKVDYRVVMLEEIPDLKRKDTLKIRLEKLP